jgi:uncharacterized membrane protein YphA (DoxX/SURF4 family)
MHWQYSHVVERMGYALVLLVLVGFLFVGQFVPNSEADILEQLLRLFALLGIVLFGLGRWVLKPPHAK